MNEILMGLLAAMMATNHVAAASNVLARTTGIRLPVVDPNDPTEKEYQKILADDDAAQEEVDKWIRDDTAFRDKGAGISSLTLNARIDQRLEPVIKAYDDFILRHPEHARVRLAYGSLLNDLGKDAEAMVQWERARELDPTNPSSWNNLADYYSHRGPVKKAFEYLAEAIELNPKEPVYYHNLATIVSAFRKDAREFYQLKDDQAVLQRALEEYRKARKLDPENFSLATDLAQTYYFMTAPDQADQKAAREAKEKLFAEAIEAWRDAQKVAHNEFERQGVSIHLARLCLTHGHLDEATNYLASVSDPSLTALKSRLTRSLEEKQKAASGAPGSAAERAPPAH